MKKGLLALMLLALVAAIPACKQRDCNDKDNGCNPCKIFSCKKKCDKKEKREKKPRKKCDPCGWLRCNKKSDKDEMNEEVAPRKNDLAPAAKKMVK